MIPFKIKVGEKEIRFPEEYGIEKLSQILKYDLEDKSTWRNILAIVFEVDRRDLEGASEEIVELAIGIIAATLSQRQEARIRQLEELSFGEFVDLEVYLSMGYTNYIIEIITILNPLIDTASKALYLIEKWLRWREGIFRQYVGLFTNDGDGEDSVTTNSKFKSAKAWYATIVDLANDDILNMQKVEELNFRMVLNFMAYRKERRMKEKLLLEKNKKRK